MGAPSCPCSLETCKYPDHPAPSCLASPAAALADPGQCPNPCTVKTERCFLRLARWKFPDVPFQPAPLPPDHPNSPHSPPHLAQCNTPVPAGSVARVLSPQPLGLPQQDKHPLHTHLSGVTSSIAQAALVSVWLNHSKTKKPQTSCLNPHRGSLINSLCGLVCDNPERGFPWHR